MNNQFCKKCGQANFPNAVSCSKCGMSLSGQPAQNPFNASQQNTPNAMANQQFANVPNTPRSEKKSKTMYWVVGGVAVFLVLFIGLIGIAAVGGLLYFNTTKEEVVRDYPKDEPANTETETPSGDDTKGSLTDEQLEDYMKNSRSRVGKYKLDNVKPFKGGDFSSRVAGITALYTSGSKRLVHSIAMFKSYSDASDDFGKYKRGIRAMKGVEIRSSAEDRMIFAHKGSVFLSFCNKEGGCHELISEDGNTILDYYNKYFGYDK